MLLLTSGEGILANNRMLKPFVHTLKPLGNEKVNQDFVKM